MVSHYIANGNSVFGMARLVLHIKKIENPFLFSSRSIEIYSEYLAFSYPQPFRLQKPALSILQ